MLKGTEEIPNSKNVERNLWKEKLELNNQQLTFTSNANARKLHKRNDIGEN